MDKLKLAYLSGFLDGEGSISIHKILRKRNNKKYVSPDHFVLVQVSQQSPKPLELYKSIFGGTICTTTTKYGNKVWRYSIASKKAKVLLENLYPYIILKKGQAKLALDFRKNCKPEFRRMGARTPAWLLNRRRERE